MVSGGVAQQARAALVGRIPRHVVVVVVLDQCVVTLAMVGELIVVALLLCAMVPAVSYDSNNRLEEAEKDRKR